MNTSRLLAFDGLRGLLALIVVASHIFLDDFGSWALFWPGRVSVLLFFAMSSHVLTRAWDRQSFPVFLARRLVRLWPVYAVCVISSTLSAGVAVQLGWLAFPLIVPFDPPAWSLGVEVRVMLIMPLIVWSGRGSLLRTLGLVAYWSALSGFGSITSYGVAFLLGARLARYDFRCAFLESAPCQWLGMISYSLYLSHSAVIRILGPWGCPLVLPMSLAVAYAIWWAVERPSITLSRMVARPRRAAGTVPA